MNLRATRAAAGSAVMAGSGTDSPWLCACSCPAEERRTVQGWCRTDPQPGHPPAQGHPPVPLPSPGHPQLPSGSHVTLRFRGSRVLPEDVVLPSWWQGPLQVPSREQRVRSLEQSWPGLEERQRVWSTQPGALGCSSRGSHPSILYDGNGADLTQAGSWGRWDSAHQVLPNPPHLHCLS